MKRAALIRFSSLGDVVLTLPVARSLKEAHPGAEIVFLTKATFRPMLEGQRGIDRVVALEDTGGGLRALARYCRNLGHFDVAIDLHRTLRSRVCLTSLRAERRLGYRKDAVVRRLWAAGWLRDRMRGTQPHVVDRYLEPLGRLGIVPAHTVPGLRVAPAELEAARALLAASGVREPGRTAVVVPGARWPNKRWSAASFAVVAAGLRDVDGIEPIIVGDAADREAAEAVRALIPGSVAVLAGQTALPVLAALLKNARVVVANDSGPAHLAAAVGAPVVALFGPTHEAFGFTPRGEHVRVISRDLPCRPCTVHGGVRCPRGRRECLDGVPPDDVLAAARDVLAGR